MINMTVVIGRMRDQYSGFFLIGKKLMDNAPSFFI